MKKLSGGCFCQEQVDIFTKVENIANAFRHPSKVSSSKPDLKVN